MTSSIMFHRVKWLFIRNTECSTDVSGNKTLINCHCNGGVFNLGHRNPQIIETLIKATEKYYKEDKFIWQLFRGVRRANRFMNTRILGKRYEFTLPGQIER